ncbi:TRNA pseudouridine synthase B [Hibiscus syriacus]|uniref:tRNA pseudouridine synthase B n=2 Tax=Hibiscus syriacus TaxID=106335 RepID=A0A6A2Z4K1_HIBSY|nr:TRNA pseudouridine synthase B [Hibiscus syriacus]
MEDAMPEAVNPREDDEVSGEERQTPEAAKEHGEERANGGGGFINHLFSNLVNGGTDGDGENRSEQAEKETISAAAEGKHDENSGGIFDHIISNLVSPLSPRTGNTSTRTQGKTEAFDHTTASENEPGLRSEGEGGGGGGGGFINNFVSNLFHHSEGEVGEGSSNKKQKVEEGGEDQSKSEKTENGGGIIHNIVSQLPTSLPESAAPSSDEATILIHIVQD